jgi:hypothetical protein
LRAILAASESEEELAYRVPVRIEGALINWIWNNYRISIDPRTAASILRDYGFLVKRSGGVNRVVVELEKLVRVCLATGLGDDELVEAEAKRMGFVGDV